MLWLIQMAAPRELIDDGLRIVADELDHAQLSAAVCQAAGNHEPPQIVRERLGAGRRAEISLELNVLAACVRFFCLGETVAVPLFKELRSQCIEPAAKAALDRILARRSTASPVWLGFTRLFGGDCPRRARGSAENGRSIHRAARPELQSRRGCR